MFRLNGKAPPSYGGTGYQTTDPHVLDWSTSVAGDQEDFVLHSPTSADMGWGTALMSMIPAVYLPSAIVDVSGGQSPTRQRNLSNERLQGLDIEMQGCKSPSELPLEKNNDGIYMINDSRSESDLASNASTVGTMLTILVHRTQFWTYCSMLVKLDEAA